MRILFRPAFLLLQMAAAFGLQSAGVAQGAHTSTPTIEQRIQHVTSGLIGGTVIGDGNVSLSGIAPAVSAKPGDLTFAENDLYFERAEQSAASAVLVDAAGPAPS